MLSKDIERLLTTILICLFTLSIILSPLVNSLLIISNIRIILGSFFPRHQGLFLFYPGTYSFPEVLNVSAQSIKLKHIMIPFNEHIRIIYVVTSSFSEWRV